MIKFLLTLAAIFFGLTIQAQVESFAWYGIDADVPSGSRELMYDIHRRAHLPVTKEKLESAQTLRDFIPYYPDQWIAGYVSTELSVKNLGCNSRAISRNDRLSREQMSMLNSADIGTDLAVCMKYKSQDSNTGKIEERMMKLTVTVMPETEAMFVGGYPKMSRFVWDHAISRINPAVSEKLQEARVGFTVNENGEIIQTKMVISSGDAQTDRMLMDAVTRMPRWKPAESKGRRVNQEFEFSIYGGGRGC